MRTPDQRQAAEIQDPIELELVALHELAAHPIVLEAQLAFIGASALVSAVESVAEEV